MPIDPIDILCILLVVAGLIFFFGASVGLLRFPDFYARMHAAGKGDTLSTLLIMAGAGLYELHHFGAEDSSTLGAILIVAKIIAIGIFIMVTSPTSTHALMQAGYDDGIEPSGQSGELRMEIPELGRSLAVSAAAPAETERPTAKKSPPRKKAAAAKKKAAAAKRATVKKVGKKVSAKKVAKKVAATDSAVAKKKKKVAAKKVVKKAAAADPSGAKKKSAAKKKATKKAAPRPKKKAAPTKKTPRREGGD